MWKRTEVPPPDGEHVALVSTLLRGDRNEVAARLVDGRIARADFLAFVARNRLQLFLRSHLDEPLRQALTPDSAARVYDCSTAEAAAWWLVSLPFRAPARRRRLQPKRPFERSAERAPSAGAPARASDEGTTP